MVGGSRRGAGAEAVLQVAFTIGRHQLWGAGPMALMLWLDGMMMMMMDVTSCPGPGSCFMMQLEG
jgi:hypothetical protein